MKLRQMLAVVAIAAVVVAAAVVPAAARDRGLKDPIPAPIPNSHFTVGLRTVASGLVSPTSGTVAPGVNDRLYVTDQTGKIWAIDVSNGPRQPTRLFADLSGLLVRLGNVLPGSQYDERGLLGLAFHPDYQHNGLLYTYQTEPWQRPADFSTEPGVRANCRTYGPPFSPRPCQNAVTEWRVRDPSDSNTTVNPQSARELFRIDKPEFNHNAGELAFGPDGLLYISVGDGGYADDQGPGHVPGGNGQSLAPGNVLGKILRIDPRGHNSTNHRYGIPRHNPFVGRGGADEIFAYGFRNPYRMSFDTATGQLYVGDTGQNDIEEVDIVHAGGNYGWRVKEGTFLFNPASPASPENGFVTANSPGRPRGLIDPVAEYDHTAPHGTKEQGEAIVGGFVYHGTQVPALAGRYVFGDYSQEFATPEGQLFFMNHSPNVTHRVTRLRIAGRPDLGLAVLGFGQDTHGEVYLLGNRTGTLAGHTGVVQQLTSG
jgi:glucose/arabinose dehydrogenase